MLSRPRQVNATRRRREAAFTLIEILVVLVIIGILLSVAMLSFGILSDDDSLDREARRLSTLIELVSDEATTQGRDFGLEFMTAGYRFVEYDPLLDQWFEVIGDDYLVQRDLDEGVEFELFLEEHKVLLHAEAQETEREQDDDEDNTYNAPSRDLTDDYLPHVLIMSSGDVTPFELRFVRFADRSEILLTMTLEGELEILADDDAVL
jgi:general secretion pathway protein H